MVHSPCYPVSTWGAEMDDIEAEADKGKLKLVCTKCGEDLNGHATACAADSQPD